MEDFSFNKKLVLFLQSRNGNLRRFSLLRFLTFLVFYPRLVSYTFDAYQKHDRMTWKTFLKKLPFISLTVLFFKSVDANRNTFSWNFMDHFPIAITVKVASCPLWPVSNFHRVYLITYYLQIPCFIYRWSLYFNPIFYKFILTKCN